MKREGPSLERLLRHLAEAPGDFLAEPRIGARGVVHVDAVVGDLVRAFGIETSSQDLIRAGRSANDKDRNRLSVALLLAWLYAERWFRQEHLDGENVLRALIDASTQLGKGAPAARYVTDPERREDLVRTALAQLGYRPAGETSAQAQDRLTSLSAVERARLVEAARAAEQRARAIREALARKAAEESADKWTRE